MPIIKLPCAYKAKYSLETLTNYASWLVQPRAEPLVVYGGATPPPPTLKFFNLFIIFFCFIWPPLNFFT